MKKQLQSPLLFPPSDVSISIDNPNHNRFSLFAFQDAFSALPVLPYKFMTAAIIENIIPTFLFTALASVEDAGDKSMLSRWHREYQQNNAKRARRQLILRAVGEGYDTLKELSAATGVPPTTCFRLLKQFEKEKKIRSFFIEIEKEVKVSKVSKICSYKELRFELI